MTTSLGFLGGNKNIPLVMALNGRFDGTANANTTETKIMAESQGLREALTTIDETWIEKVAKIVTYDATGSVGVVLTRRGLEKKDATRAKYWRMLEA